jgi:hypothetical protein
MPGSGSGSGSGAGDLSGASPGGGFKLEHPAPAPSSPTRTKASPKASKPKGEPDPYAEAYAAGITDATGMPFTPPNLSRFAAVFWPAVKAHARHRDGTPLEGAAAHAWLREHVRGYRAQVEPGRERYENGFAPTGFVRWLDSGMPGYEPTRTRPVEPDPPPDPRTDDEQLVAFAERERFTHPDPTRARQLQEAFDMSYPRRIRDLATARGIP